MHDRELVHVVQSFKDLDREALGERHREALEIIILDELVQVDTQHLEDDAHMASEREAVLDPHYVLAVVHVAIPQGLEDLDLDLSLLMELLPVLQDFEGYMLFSLVVIAAENHSECASSQLLENFISVQDLVLGFIKEVSLIIVKSMVEDSPWSFLGVFVLVSELPLDVLANPLVLGRQVDVVDQVVVQDLISLVLGQLPAIQPDHVLGVHRELVGRALAGLSGRSLDLLLLLEDLVVRYLVLQLDVLLIRKVGVS